MRGSHNREAIARNRLMYVYRHAPFCYISTCINTNYSNNPLPSIQSAPISVQQPKVGSPLLYALPNTMHLDGELASHPPVELRLGILSMNELQYQDDSLTPAHMGHRFMRDLQLSASNLEVAMKLHNDQAGHRMRWPNCRIDQSQLEGLFNRFQGTINDLPAEVAVFRTQSCPLDGSGPFHFQAQYDIFISSYHCLRLILLHQAIQFGIQEIMGVERNTWLMTAKKMEIIEDFIAELRRRPLEWTQGQGQPMVSLGLLSSLGCTTTNSTID